MNKNETLKLAEEAEHHIEKIKALSRETAPLLFAVCASPDDVLDQFCAKVRAELNILRGYSMSIRKISEAKKDA